MMLAIVNAICYTYPCHPDMHIDIESRYINKAYMLRTHTSAHTQEHSTQSTLAHLQHLSWCQQRTAALQDAAVHWLAAASAPQPAAAGLLPQTRWPAPGIHCV